MYPLWQDLSLGTVIFDLVTLTLKFDLLLKNINLGCYLVMVAARWASLSSDNSYCACVPLVYGETKFERFFTGIVVLSISVKSLHLYSKNMYISWQIGISLDETVEKEDLKDLLTIVGSNYTMVRCVTREIPAEQRGGLSFLCSRINRSGTYCFCPVCLLST